MEKSTKKAGKRRMIRFGAETDILIKKYQDHIHRTLGQRISLNAAVNMLIHKGAKA
jgi:hypothetical protein